MTTVSEYLIQRFVDLGIDKAFGVPGDFPFPILDAIEASASLQWIGCVNELNAAFSADGYARLRGASLLCTTYGVGELSALNGLMGSKAHRLPVFLVVGASCIRNSALITSLVMGFMATMSPSWKPPVVSRLF